MIAQYLIPSIHVTAAAAFRRTHAKAIDSEDENARDARSGSIPTLDRAHLEALAENSDAHPIKLTEAALRAYQATGDELFLKAAGKVQNYGFWRNLSVSGGVL
jgi:hypothetical protein